MKKLIAILMILIAIPVYAGDASKTYSIKAYDEISNAQQDLVWFSVDDPIGSLVEVTNVNNGKKIVVRTIQNIDTFYWNGVEMLGYLPRKERAMLGEPNNKPVIVTTRVIKRGVR